MENNARTVVWGPGDVPERQGTADKDRRGRVRGSGSRRHFPAARVGDASQEARAEGDRQVPGAGGPLARGSAACSASDRRPCSLIYIMGVGGSRAGLGMPHKHCHAESCSFLAVASCSLQNIRISSREDGVYATRGYVVKSRPILANAWSSGGNRSASRHEIWPDMFAMTRRLSFANPQM